MQPPLENDFVSDKLWVIMRPESLPEHPPTSDPYRNAPDITQDLVQENRQIAVIYHEGSPLFISRGITPKQIIQVLKYSAEQDEDLYRFTHDAERFSSREAFDRWSAKGRTVYTLSDAQGNLQGIVWFGKKQLPVADYQFPINAADYPYTLAIRLYRNVRGKHLAVEFMRIAAKDFSNSRVLDSQVGIWVDPDQDNQRSIVALCKSNSGLVQVSKPNEKNRVILVSQRIFDAELEAMENEGQATQLVRTEYAPFSRIEGFSVSLDTSGNTRFLSYKDSCGQIIYTLEIKQPDGFVPRNGLLLALYITNYVDGKRVVDVGCGETGFLAVHAAMHGATKVVGLDIDGDAINWARHNGRINGLSQVDWKTSDLFSSIAEEAFDVIVSNPPQLPMPVGPRHDWGGVDGREVVERLITDAPHYLEKGGQLFMVLFDFLGVDVNYGDKPPLKEAFAAAGFDVEIIGRSVRKIRHGGQTERLLGYILEQYPRFVFTKENETFFHELLVVRARLKG